MWLYGALFLFPTFVLFVSVVKRNMNSHNAALFSQYDAVFATMVARFPQKLPEVLKDTAVDDAGLLRGRPARSSDSALWSPRCRRSRLRSSLLLRLLTLMDSSISLLGSSRCAAICILSCPHQIRTSLIPLLPHWLRWEGLPSGSADVEFFHLSIKCRRVLCMLRDCRKLRLIQLPKVEATRSSGLAGRLDEIWNMMISECERHSQSWWRSVLLCLLSSLWM